MASPVTKVTAMSATLSQRLRSTGSDTSITFAVTATDPWSSVTTGVMKVNEGSSSEWIAFTGITVNSSTSITLTGCTRGLDKDATSLTDNSSGYKKDHGVGTVGYLVLHSATINKFPELDADNTFTGSIAFSGTTGIPKMKLPVYTTAQRDTLTSVADGHIIFNSSLGVSQIYTGGAWYDLSTGTTTIPLATDAIAGRVFLDVAAANPATPTVPGTNSTRIFDTTTSSATGAIRISKETTGSRSATLSLHGDDTYTSGGLIIERANTGADATSTITHRGTGDFKIFCDEDASIYFNTGGSVKLDKPTTGAFTAGTTLVAGDWVYMDSSTGKLQKSDRTTIEKATFVGVVIVGGATDETVYVQTGGVYTTSGLTAGSTYWVSGTAGAITATAPATNSASIVPMQVGRALTTTQLLIAPRRTRRILNFAGSGVSSTTIVTLTTGFEVEEVYVNIATGYSTSPLFSEGRWMNPTNRYFGIRQYAATGLPLYPIITGTDSFIAEAGQDSISNKWRVTVAENGANIDVTFTKTGGPDNVNYAALAYEFIQ